MACREWVPGNRDTHDRRFRYLRVRRLQRDPNGMFSETGDPRGRQALTNLAKLYMLQFFTPSILANSIGLTHGYVLGTVHI